MKLSTQKQTGFTLIELMIVVAIIGIIASVAVPAYQDYIARSQVSEAIVLTGGIKSPLASFVYENGRQPATLASLSVNTSGLYVQSIIVGGTVSDMTVTSIMKLTGVNSQIAGRTLVYRSTDRGYSWSCDEGTIEESLRPGACK